MYCVKCGVKLADTEQKCPLCGTDVYHPQIQQSPALPLYPKDKIPRNVAGRTILGISLTILYLIPLIVCFFSDLQMNRQLDWFGYAGGALMLWYTITVLPLWFRKSRPVTAVFCDYLAVALYLLYINLATGGSWFLTFALPVTAGFGLVTCAVVALFLYIGRGKLFIMGGTLIALGILLLMLEFLLSITFSINFIGWSVYPLIVLALLGGLMIHLASHSSTREMMERKLFF